MTLAVRAPALEDRATLLEWRNDPRVRAMSVTSRPITADEHEGWYATVLAERLDQLLIVLWGDDPVGVVQLEAVDVPEATASWGCHLGRVDVPPGVGAALPLIGLGLGFGRWGFRRMTANVLGVNTNMLAMHRRFRIPEEGVRRQHLRRDDGELVDVHEYGVLAAEWPEIRDRGAGLLPRQLRTDLGHVFDALGDRRSEPGR